MLKDKPSIWFILLVAGTLVFVNAAGSYLLRTYGTFTVQALFSAAFVFVFSTLVFRYRSLNRKMAHALEKALVEARKSERLLRTVIDTSPDMILLKDTSNRFITVNAPLASSTGLSPDEYVGKNDLEVGYPADIVVGNPEKGIRGYWQDDKHVFETGETTVIPEEYLMIQGEQRVVKTVKTALRNENGQVIGLLCFIRDITDLKKFESDVRKKDKLLEALAKATNELIVDPHIESAIGKSVQLLGNSIPVDQVNVYKFKTDDGHEYAEQFVQWFAENDTWVRHDESKSKPFTIIPEEIFAKLKKQEIFHKQRSDFQHYAYDWFEQLGINSIAFIPIICNEQLWGHVSFYDKNANRQWNEVELAILNSFSSSLGSAIERKAIEVELLAAMEQAESASKAKSMFMANMSHELRTPLNGIIGFTDLLLTTEMQVSQKEYLMNVSKSGNNLLELINDILDFSKIEAGKLLIDPVPFSVIELVQECAETLSIKGWEKNIEIVCNIDPETPTSVKGDPVRVRQILLNLLSNAIKFTTQGEIVVTLNGAPAANLPAGRTSNFAISIKDSGIGIPREKLDKIFESFTQADSSTTRKFGGTGLGLTISKSLAELMGGTITVESEENKGSIFTLELPFQVLNELPLVSLEEKPGLNRVLVVDDNSINCDLLENIFNYLSIECVTCLSAVKALDLLKQSAEKQMPFDLIITDHQMPEMDGITFAHELKKQGIFDQAHPYILMLSSLGKTLYENEARKIGIDQFLVKPVKIQVLQSLLSHMFKAVPTQATQANEGVLKVQSFQKRFTALVVEDQEVNMFLMSEVLSRMNIEVIKAFNGQEAFSLVQTHELDIVFMDINMPVMDGYTATRHIRNLSSGSKDVPIIALTADAMQEDREKCKHAGMNEFISKPFRFEELNAVLNKYLQN